MRDRFKTFSKHTIVALLDCASRGLLYEGRTLPGIGTGTAPSSAQAVRKRISSLLKVTSRTCQVLHSLLRTKRGDSSELVAARKQTKAQKSGSVVAERDDRLTFASVTFDPRVLAFEFVTTFMVRPAQMKLVCDFTTELRGGKSSVTQMLMGGGKTSVITPLLALLLADGDNLVCAVMPEALLDHSIGEIADKLKQVTKRPVVKFEFHRKRAEDQAEAVLARYTHILQMLRTARQDRGIVCSNPSSIKSLMLEFVDSLQHIMAEQQKHPVLSLSEAAVTQLEWAARYRLKNACKEACEQLVGAKVHELEEQVHVLRQILELFRSRAIALVDEVDLVLHPLKSELNFPIGTKQECDLSSERWQLPIHLLEGLFYSSGASQRLALPAAGALTAEGSHGRRALDSLGGAFQKGIADMAVQQQPLLLLQNEFYESDLKEPLARWALAYFVPWARRSDDSKGQDESTTLPSFRATCALRRRIARGRR
jgi:hypothetical protein